MTAGSLTPARSPSRWFDAFRSPIAIPDHRPVRVTLQSECRQTVALNVRPRLDRRRARVLRLQAGVGVLAPVGDDDGGEAAGDEPGDAGRSGEQRCERGCDPDGDA